MATGILSLIAYDEATQTRKLLIQEASEEKYDAIIHIGDFAYDMGMFFSLFLNLTDSFS